ncbi:DUF488 domain-containing protein [Nakamurella aerolata]|uniref:DUF488 family protein n=1 Tax=Nakamurella aerolata TaxID=1656892 RepID=A0A849A6Q8_9ACTN|nr:DUF488 family protein [Nakamurella aerolata]NNG36239.1 DUF488 family protein [Nakamurella aerolata]
MTAQPNGFDVKIKRAYAEAEPSDGRRVLVDRLWPRGVSKQRADLSDWLKQIAPSTELREWYGHDPAKFDEFAQRYRAELTGDSERAEALTQLRAWASGGPLTLITATKDPAISEAQVLLDVLRGSRD